MQYLLRNPRTLNGALFSGAFTALLCLALYWKVGQFPRNYDDVFVDQATTSAFYTFLFNLNGFGFLLSNNISFSSSNQVIL